VSKIHLKRTVAKRSGERKNR